MVGLQKNYLKIMEGQIIEEIKSTGCPRKNFPVCFLAITTSNLHQIQKGRSVLKSAGPEDFKTDLDFQFWPSRS